MATVAALLEKELTQLNEQKDKKDKLQNSLKVRMRGIGPPSQESDEIKELEAKLNALTIPDEA